jgi:hypothetical protein
LVLEWAGVLPAAYAFTGGGIVVTPNLVQLHEWPSRILIGLGSLLVVVAPALIIWPRDDTRYTLRRQLHFQNWHLQKLVPQPSAISRSMPPPPT